MNKMNAFVRFGWKKNNGKPLANLDLWKRIAFWHAKCFNIRVIHVSRDAFVPGNSYEDRKVLRDLLRKQTDAA